MSELPQTWVLTTIGDISVDCTQKIPSAEETFYYIDIASVDRTTKSIVTPQTLLGKNAPSRARKLVRSGDVLVSMTRPNLNAVAIVTENMDDQIASTGFDVIRANGIEPRWIFFLVRTQDFVNRMSELVQGALYPAVRSKDIRGYEALLAPLNEQKRIADKLDAVLARVDACRERLDRIPAILKRFRQSVLAAATSGKLTEEWRATNTVDVDGAALLSAVKQSHLDYTAKVGLKKKKKETVDADLHSETAHEESLYEIPSTWAWGMALDLVEPGADIVYGIVQPGPKLDEGVPYVRGMDIENGRILVEQLLKTSPVIAERYYRSTLKGGDVLLGIIRATKVAIVPEEISGANITQGTARYRPSFALRTKYLAAVLEAPAIQSWLHAHYRGIDMPGLNLADVRQVPIPVPPIDEQVEIVRRVESLFAYADRLEARYATARAQVEKLTPALLAKAFRGELVPQDPNDEPASALLERIRASRVATPAKPKSLKGTTRRKKVAIEDLPMVAESRAVYERKKRRA